MPKVRFVQSRNKIVLGVCLAIVGIGGSFAAGVIVGRKMPGEIKSPPIVPQPSSNSGAEVEPLLDTTCATTELRVLNLGKPVVWAALGDSYSAGVGGPLNQQLWGQDIFNAYSVAAVQRVQANDALKIQLNLSACGGAKIPELVGNLTAASVAQALQTPAGLDTSWWSKTPPPLGGLEDADVASITLGGNDVGFGAIGRQCALGDCDAIVDGGPGGDVRGDTPDAQWATVRERLADAYGVVRQMMKAEGTLFVLDYPIPFDDVSTHPCPESRLLGKNDVALVNLFAGRLNQTISEAVDLANHSLNVGSDRDGNIVLIPWHTSTEGPTPTYTFFLDGHAESSQVPYNPGGLCDANPMTVAFGPFVEDREWGDTLHPSDEGVRIAGCRLGLAVSQLESLHLAQPAFDSTSC